MGMEEIVLNDVICYAKALVDSQKNATFANQLWKEQKNIITKVADCVKKPC